MYRILMVEDDECEAETLRHSLERYARENSVEFQVSWEKSAKQYRDLYLELTQ